MYDKVIFSGSFGILLDQNESLKKSHEHEGGSALRVEKNVKKEKNDDRRKK